ncbi:MAG: DUF255 domain-containing protein [Candidatus Sumerlaeaceae bacterium]
MQAPDVVTRRSTAFLALALGAVAAAGYSQDLIIEAGREGKNTSQYRELAGKWMDSRIPPQVAKSTAPGLTPPGACSSRKTVFCGPNIVTSGPAIARFSPRFPTPGHYHVYATWPRGANATPVRYVIKYAGGDTTTRKLTQNGWGGSDKDCNAGTWIDLGDYDFDAGEDQFVELHVEPDVKLLEPNWYGQAYADAIRFSEKPLTDRGVAMSSQAPPPWPGSEPPTIIAGKPLKWNPDIAAAWRDAKSGKKKILLYFFSDDAFLDYYEKQLFTDPAVQAFLDTAFVPVRIDMHKQPEVAKKLGGVRAGTLAVYENSGKPLGLISEPLAAADFMRRLQSF